MSRVGKLPIPVPAGVTVTIDGQRVDVTGPLGKLQLVLLPGVSASLQDQQLTVAVQDPDRPDQRAQWGLFRNLLRNMVTGVSAGFRRTLEINGIGFKAALQGKDLALEVGFSHPVIFTPPPGVTVSVEKNLITVTGFDRQVVGQAAANIRAIKEPEPYKGKGIRYSDEVVRRKAGKVVKGAGA